MYPPLGTLVRKAVKDYPVPGTQLTIPAGQTVLIPVHAIQHDANIYAEPERFDPDRFAPAARADRDLVAFLAFGQGPRNCIGLRFGMMQTRIGLVKLLSGYRVRRTDRTPVPLVYSKTGFLLNVEGGMMLRLTKLS